MSERRVLLIVHTAREEATSLAARLATDLRSADIGVCVLESDRDDLVAYLRGTRQVPLPKE